MPARRSSKIYHITHLGNLTRIVAAGRLWSDAKRVELGLECEIVGMSEIKRRRLEEIEVSCFPGTKVGEYVPFYFCPRSIMLFILHRGNHPDVTYREGQGRIVHLQADLEMTIRWADEAGVRWAYSDRNAGAFVAEFFTGRDDLGKIDWSAVAALDFRNPVTKEGKQAEFLTFEAFPWDLVEEVGVMDDRAAEEVRLAVAAATHRPRIAVRQTWYF